jgi:hypothetical protein
LIDFVLKDIQAYAVNGIAPLALNFMSVSTTRYQNQWQNQFFWQMENFDGGRAKRNGKLFPSQSIGFLEILALCESRDQGIALALVRSKQFNQQEALDRIRSVTHLIAKRAFQ